ncbi:MAG: serine hydrolase [Flammeovirgaceae bacterium]|nr:serine hydrolase [Flammeovirgaceae bacterium]
MRNISLIIIALILPYTGIAQSKTKSTPIYYPQKEWEKKSPEEVGMNAATLKQAIEFAIQAESKTPKNLEEAHYQSFGREPFGDGVGPFMERGAASGIIVKNGYIIGEWGDLHRTDMTFSVTKSFLSTVVGLAYDQGLISDILDPVYQYVPPVYVYEHKNADNKANQFGQPQMITPFETPHNRTVTWNDMLRQTSDWEGTLWGKPDWADRPSNNRDEWLTRARAKSGTVYEYNDVRVNALALAALSVWRKPLPEVLKEKIMDPIGASNTWRWYGYDNSWIVLDGQIVQSVSGGGHWGGGMFIGAYDMARFGYLTLRRGKWEGKQLLSDKWVTWALTPTPAQPTYGFMNWFLNTNKEYLPSAPEKSFVHIGNGTNMIYVDPDNDLVVVARWIERNKMDEFVKKILVSNSK